MSCPERTVEETWEKDDEVVTLCGNPNVTIWDDGNTIWDATGILAGTFWDPSGIYGVVRRSRVGNGWTVQWD